MARVSSNVIGNFSGKLGNLSARINHGRTILAARPASFNAPMDASAIERRNIFLATLKFATQVANLPVLKKVWAKVTPSDLSEANQIVSANYKYSSAAKPTVDNIITPGGFVLNIQNTLLDAAKLTADIPALTTVAIMDPAEVNCNFSVVICYHTPLAEGDDPYNIITLSKDVPNFQFGVQYNLQLDLNIVQKAIAAKYDGSIVYLAVVPKTADDRILHYSSTFVAAF